MTTLFDPGEAGDGAGRHTERDGAGVDTGAGDKPMPIDFHPLGSTPEKA